jgi:hypothetical protein
VIGPNGEGGAVEPLALEPLSLDHGVIWAGQGWYPSQNKMYRDWILRTAGFFSPLGFEYANRSRCHLDLGS